MLEVEPNLKRELYLALEVEGMTMKDWFLRSATTYIQEHRQPPLFRAEQSRVPYDETSSQRDQKKKSPVKYKENEPQG